MYEMVFSVCSTSSYWRGAVFWKVLRFFMLVFIFLMTSFMSRIKKYTFCCIIFKRFHLFIKVNNNNNNKKYVHMEMRYISCPSYDKKKIQLPAYLQTLIFVWVMHHAAPFSSIKCCFIFSQCNSEHTSLMSRFDNFNMRVIFFIYINNYIVL
jgi:hypothetical protein